MLTLCLVLPWVGGVLLGALDGRRRAVGLLALALLVATLACTVVLAAEVFSHGPRVLVTGGWPAGIGIRLRADATGVAFAVVVSVVVTAAFAFELGAHVEHRMFPALVVILLAGLNGLFLTADVFNFYVFFEIAMASSFALTGYGGQRREIHAAYVFMAVNIVGSVLFLLGIAALYHQTGALDMNDVSRALARQPPRAALGLATAFFVAFSLKLGLSPFHLWLPTVYRGSRTAVTALLAGAVACIGSYGILRFGVQVLHAQLALGRPVLLVLGGASAVYGGIAAISQRTTSGVLAYSSVAQAGFIWLAVGLGGVAGYTAAIVYALANALNKGLGFLAAPNDKRMVKVSFAIAAFSITGLPPTLGFWAKFSLFESAWLGGAPLTSVVLMAASALSFLYVYPVYQRGAWRDSPVAPALPLAQRAVTWGLVALVLGLGLWPAPLYAFAARGARELMEGRGP